MELDVLFKSAVKASRSLALLGTEKINAILRDVAEEAIREAAFLIAENEKDLSMMNSGDPKFDRLKLTEKRIYDIASDIRNVASLQSPLSEVILEKKIPNGLLIKKVRVPIGVVGVIYEARPNVTFDVFSLCLKTGNVAVLKGGSDAAHSNVAIASVIRRVLLKHQVDPAVMVLLPAERQATEALLNARDYVDVIIPRGSQQLIDFVREHSRVPVIETGAGIVHTFFDKTGDTKKGKAIINNAKTRRVSVCNALDCLLIHADRLADLPELTMLLEKSGVKIFADARAYGALTGAYSPGLLQQASDEHFGIEFLDYKMSVKTVDSLDEAIEHISRYSSKHSEAIISENAENIEKFLNAVDAAAVYANSSTAFTDGGQFGLGAEIGISTQKLHARGPMGLEELTSYKWIVKGEGQIREN